MPATVIVNKRTVVHMKSDGVATAFPDVCNTPTPGGPVPIPYPNVALSKDTAMGTTSVTADGCPVMVKGSCFAVSTGDEAGSAGGVASTVVKGKAEFVSYSFDVKYEGKNVARLGDTMVQNKGTAPNTPPFPEVQPPLIGIPSKEPDPDDDIVEIKLISKEEFEKG